MAQKSFLLDNFLTWPKSQCRCRSVTKNLSLVAVSRVAQKIIKNLEQIENMGDKNGIKI